MSAYFAFVPSFVGRRIHTTLLVAPIGFLLVILVACTRVTLPVSFEGLCGLTPEQFETMDEEAVVQWIQDKHTPSPSREEQRRGGEKLVIYSWVSNEREWYARLREGRLCLISIYDIENGPTFGQVVDSLGPPETISRYATRYEDTVYAIKLDYSTLGLSVAHDGWMRGYVTDATLSKHMRVNDVYCYTPGSMEDVLREAFLIPPENIPMALQRQIPWPGFGASVPLDDDP